MSLIFDNGNYQHTIGRGTYTKKVLKHNHYAWGRYHGTIWNTVHCGPRDDERAMRNLAMQMATNAAKTVTSLTADEFQYLHEYTDANGITLYLDGKELRFYRKGAWHSITKGMKRGTVVELLKKLELYGSTQAAKASERAAKVKKTVALGLMKATPAQAETVKSKPVRKGEHPDFPPALLSVCAGASSPIPRITSGSRKKTEMLAKFGLPQERRAEYRAFARWNKVALQGLRARDLVSIFLGEGSYEEILLSKIHSDYCIHGCPRELVQEFCQWKATEGINIGNAHKPRLKKAIAAFLSWWEEKQAATTEQPIEAVPAPVVEPEAETVVPELVAVIEPEEEIEDDARVFPIISAVNVAQPVDKVICLPLADGNPAPLTRKPRQRKPGQTLKGALVERAKKEDVRVYGVRRRSQAQFRADVALNCNDRCVITNASAMRCEAAHLVPHARKGGASFRNGLLMRSDIHALFDAGECAIDPETMTLHFTLTIRASDPDLEAYEGKRIETVKPVKTAALVARWDAFLELYLNTEVAA